MAEGTSENITETIYDPGNVTIHACHLKHGDEVINLVGGLDEFIVTYSTLNNSASCKATILDTIQQQGFTIEKESTTIDNTIELVATRWQ